MNKGADKTKSSEKIRLGVPVDDFEATVDALQQLCQEGKYQIFLAREGAFKFVGEIDELRLDLGKKFGADVIDRKRIARCLQELKMLLQVCIVSPTPATAVNFIETRIYDDDFAKVKKDPVQTENLRQILQQKVNAVFGKLLSDAFRERFKRLESAVGPVLEDIDVELISRRRSPVNDADINAPFLRIRLLHTTRGNSAFFVPAWIANPARDMHTFDLECDETDIDLLIRRLLQAKELLSKAIEAKVAIETKAEVSNRKQDEIR